MMSVYSSLLKEQLYEMLATTVHFVVRMSDRMSLQGETIWPIRFLISLLNIRETDVSPVREILLRALSNFSSESNNEVIKAYLKELQRHVSRNSDKLQYHFQSESYWAFLRGYLYFFDRSGRKTSDVDDEHGQWLFSSGYARDLICGSWSLLDVGIIGNILTHYILEYQGRDRSDSTRYDQFIKRLYQILSRLALSQHIFASYLSILKINNRSLWNALWKSRLMSIGQVQPIQQPLEPSLNRSPEKENSVFSNMYSWEFFQSASFWGLDLPKQNDADTIRAHQDKPNPSQPGKIHV